MDDRAEVAVAVGQVKGAKAAEVLAVRPEVVDGRAVVLSAMARHRIVRVATMDGDRVARGAPRQQLQGVPLPLLPGARRS